MLMKTNRDKQEEIENLIKRFDIFYDFLIKNGTSAVLLGQAKDIAYNAYKGNSLTTLKRISKELDVWLKEMPKESQLELSHILKEKLNEDIKDNSLDKIGKIVKRGQINNLKEYEMLLKRVEETYADDSKKEEVMKLNELLADYHRRTDKKLQ